MVDLTKLSKQELIKEFNFIIGKHQRLSSIRGDIRGKQSEIRGKIHSIRQGIEKPKERIAIEKKITNVYHFVLIGLIIFCILFVLVHVKEFIKLWVNNWYANNWINDWIKNKSYNANTSMKYTIGINAIHSWFFKKDRLITLIIGVPALASLSYQIFLFVLDFMFLRKWKMYDKIVPSLIEKNEVIISLKEELQQLEQEEIGIINKINNIRSRNNLSPRYHGYEMNLRDYLVSGRADTLKDALLLQDTNWHREAMLAEQQRQRASIQNLNNKMQASMQDLNNKIENQTAYISDLENEISKLTR